VFHYASVGKLFVWTVAIQLVEQGLLDLDADISIYLPEYLNQQFAFEHAFSMRDLMNHSAGFGENILGIAFNAQTLETATILREALLSTQPPQLFEPGTVSAYSNFGTALAGYIISHISEQDFSNFVAQNILIPTGMVNTMNQADWFANRDFLQRKAIGYISNGRGGFVEGIWVYSPLYPAGSTIGTAEDLARLAIALMPAYGESGVLFENAYTLASLFTPSTLDPQNFLGTHHGFMGYAGAYPSFGHSGDAPSFSANFAIVLERRFGVIVLSNAGNEFNIRFEIMDLLLGQSTEMDISDNLPNVSAVEGRFLRARSMAGSFLEFLDFLAVPTASVTALDENTISITYGALGSLVYRQVEPYVFRLVSHDGIAFTIFGDEIRFRMAEGSPVQMHIGNGQDHLPVASFRSAPSLILSVIAALVSMLFFLIMPIILLVSYLRNLKKDTHKSLFCKLSNMLLLCGTLLVLNNLASIVRIFVINMFRTATEIAPHILIKLSKSLKV